MRQPDERAMKLLSPATHVGPIPQDFARFERQHTRDRAHQTGLAAAVWTLEQQQLAAI